MRCRTVSYDQTPTEAVCLLAVNSKLPIKTIPTHVVFQRRGVPPEPFPPECRFDSPSFILLLLPITK